MTGTTARNTGKNAQYNVGRGDRADAEMSGIVDSIGGGVQCRMCGKAVWERDDRQRKVGGVVEQAAHFPNSGI
jgi:hypothetical protein